MLCWLLGFCGAANLEGLLFIEVEARLGLRLVGLSGRRPA